MARNVAGAESIYSLRPHHQDRTTEGPTPTNHGKLIRSSTFYRCRSVPPIPWMPTLARHMSQMPWIWLHYHQRLVWSDTFKEAFVFCLQLLMGHFCPLSFCKAVCSKKHTPDFFCLWSTLLFASATLPRGTLLCPTHIVLSESFGLTSRRDSIAGLCDHQVRLLCLGFCFALF